MTQNWRLNYGTNHFIAIQWNVIGYRSNTMLWNCPKEGNMTCFSIISPRYAVAYNCSNLNILSAFHMLRFSYPLEKQHIAWVPAESHRLTIPIWATGMMPKNIHHHSRVRSRREVIIKFIQICLHHIPIRPWYPSFSPLLLGKSLFLMVNSQSLITT